MSKRTPGLPRRANGFWPTPRAAVAPLVPFLPRSAPYGEPCAGDGSMINALADLWPGGRCVWASDIDPKGPGIEQEDARQIPSEVTDHVGLWITNPPWPEGGKRGDPALSIITALMETAPVWSLLPWDFFANGYFARLAPACSDVVPIGRVSWMGNGQAGKDNACWARFEAQNRRPTALWPRAVAMKSPEFSSDNVTDGGRA